MSDRTMELDGGLIHRLTRYLIRKVFEILLLFNHKSAGSINVLAIFSKAAIFTWKFLRDRSKWRMAPPVSSDVSAGGSHGVV